jgi:Fe-S oxidoreductase
MEGLIRQAEAAGFVIKAVLTSCGTCREGIRNYRLKSLETRQVEFQDVVQFIIQQGKGKFGQGPEQLLYHAACHHEWTGVSPLKAGEIYASELGKMVGSTVAISPHCCGESGLGALTSPKIYNRLRLRKKEQLAADLTGYPAESPVVVGCPSCKIGISRTLLEMGVKRDVMHTLEFLARLRHGDTWRKDFHKLLAKSSAQNDVQTLTRIP